MKPASASGRMSPARPLNGEPVGARLTVQVRGGESAWVRTPTKPQPTPTRPPKPPAIHQTGRKCLATQKGVDTNKTSVNLNMSPITPAIRLNEFATL